MSDRFVKPQEHISDNLCRCNICTGAHHKRIGSIFPAPAKTNCLQEFLDYFPRNFPLLIVNTAFPKSKIFYFNKFTNRLMTSPYTKMAQHFPLATNVILFYPTKTTIAHKYELMKQDNNYIYVQAYFNKIPLVVRYSGEDKFADMILEEKMPILIKEMIADEYCSFSETSRQFLNWAHKEYGDLIFCKFMTKLYCTFAERTHLLYIDQGEFQWVVQKVGIIRLANVKSFKIEKLKKTLTFQQQYEQKVLEKINTGNVFQIKLFNVSVKKEKINRRVNDFKNEIRNIFQEEKNKILQKTEKERVLETKSPSDEIAKLFLPELHKYSSLREVLNDEKKFKKVVLGIDQQSSSIKEHQFKMSKMAKKKAISSVRPNSLFLKYGRCKTQV